MKPNICLGSAQFGLEYGITNSAGKVTEKTVAQILAEARDGGIRFIDTAQAYGNAQMVIGRSWPAMHSFRVINKLAAQSQQVFHAKDRIAWEQAFDSSCKQLRKDCIDTLLLHAPGDLRKRGGKHLEEWLIDLRQEGKVKRLGVSIYTAGDLEGVSRALLDVVQLPLSLYDQRLIHDGTVADLRKQGTAIHARSIYLQGLLLATELNWPNWVQPEIRAHHSALEALAKHRGCGLIDLALGFAKEQADVEAVIVGLCSVDELRELQASWREPSPWRDGEWQTWCVQDHEFLDLRRWPKAS